MSTAVVWLIAGIVLVAAEVLSGSFVLLMLGGAALAAATTAALLDVGVLTSALTFGGASVLLLLAVRPAMRRRLGQGVDPTAMHTEALVGRAAVVVARVDGDGGRVKIGSDLWSARAYDHTQVIEPGERVTVITISGATALVLAEY